MSTYCLWHRLPPLLLLGGVRPLLPPLLWWLGLGLLLSPLWFCKFCPYAALLPLLVKFTMLPLMLTGVSWPRRRRFSPTMAIKSSTTPTRIWRNIFGP